MADQQTELGGPQREFPRTTANFVRDLRNPDPRARDAVMAALAERYWKPVYHFLRLSYGKGNEDAKDLTQAFFAWLLERDLLVRYDPARSSFRTFLKGVLRNFAGNEHQALRRLKRGGDVKIVPLDPTSVETGGPLDQADPDRAFEAVFLKDAVSRAIERVRRRFQAGRRIVTFLAFQEYHLTGAAEPPTYAELAKRLGVKESDVRNYLHEVREAIRDEVRAEFTGDGGELPDEVARLFSK